jgi:VWFA-related protein
VNRTTVFTLIVVLLSAAVVAASPQEELRVRIVAPGDGTYVSGPTVISAAVTPVADTAIARVTFEVDGGVVGVVEEPPYEVTYDFGEQFSSHLIEVTAVDITGREASADVLTRDLETAVFRAEVSAVLLYVTAIDGRGRYVADLTADDFEVYENGRRQEITNFTSEPRPFVAGLLLDTSGSMEGLKIQRARQGALAFLDQVGNEDEVFIMTFDSFPQLQQDLTNNLSLLRESLDSLRVGGATALNMAIVEGSDILAERPERRALIVLSDGYDTTQTISVDQAVDYARRQDVRVYSIGIFDGGGTDLRGRRSFDSFNLGEDYLRSFADGTGGRAIILDSLGELLAAYEDIANELKSQYALAYRPSDPADPGEWREIEVKADGAKEVRTKPGYFGGEQL